MATRRISYKTQGTCSTMIEVTIDENDIIRHVVFHGGCNGNLQGISRLVCGCNINEIADKIRGIRCGARTTSCPDQLCKALEILKEQ